MNKKTVVILMIFIAFLGILFTGIIGVMPTTDSVILPKKVSFELDGLQGYKIIDEGTDNQQKIIYMEVVGDGDNQLLKINGQLYDETPFSLLPFIVLTLDNGEVVQLDEGNAPLYLTFSVTSNDENSSDKPTINIFGDITFIRPVGCTVTIQAKDASNVVDWVRFSIQTDSGGEIDPEW